MKRGVIIQGSARSNGDTHSFVQRLKSQTGYVVIDLKEYNIGHFDYSFENRDDDFLPLIRELLTKYDHFVLATPIYWYTMSGHMKVFLDRISDLLINEKETGRLFRSKSLSVLSVSNDDKVEDTFYVPFRNTAEYLGMEYIGASHAYTAIAEEVLEGRYKILLSSI